MTPETRAEVIARDGGRCVRCGYHCGDCGPVGEPRRHSVHHRKLKSQGGTDDLANLILLCGSGSSHCHHLVHSKRRDIGEPGGYIVPSHADPATIPVLYHQRGPVLL